MRVLADTHTFIWWVEDNPKLGPKARKVIETSHVFVSTASAWEMSIKNSIGRLDFDEPLEDWIPREMKRNGFQSLYVSLEHAIQAGQLPQHHQDPFDRMLIAQARLEGLTLLTSDRRIPLYQVVTLDAEKYAFRRYLRYPPRSKVWPLNTVHRR